MLGAVIGDIVGSAYKTEKIKSKEFPLFSKSAHFTDETVCTLALAEALLNSACPAKTLRRWCRDFELEYKPHFARWIKNDEAGPYQGHCNGAATRVSSAGYLAHSRPDAQDRASRLTIITHNHPRGQVGAAAITSAIWSARLGSSARLIRELISHQYGYNLRRSVEDIRPTYSASVFCEQSVPEAIICAIDATGFEDAIRNAVSLGGESDTLAAMTGSIAEAMFGIPGKLKDSAREYLDPRMIKVLDRAYKNVRLLG